MVELLNTKLDLLDNMRYLVSLIVMIAFGSINCNNSGSNPQVVLTKKRKNMNSLSYESNLAFCKFLESTCIDHGVDSLTKWLTLELKDQRIIILGNKEHSVSDFALNEFHDTKITNVLISFRNDQNPETSNLIGVFNLVHLEPRLQLVLRGHRQAVVLPGGEQ